MNTIGNYLYILRSKKNDTYYIGSTNDFDRRKLEHYQGRSKYTRIILPVEIVYLQKFTTLLKARKAERWLKKQKDRKFIERIITEGKINKRFN